MRSNERPSVLRSTSKRSLFFSLAVRQASCTAFGPLASAVKATSSTGSGVPALPSVQSERLAMLVFVTVLAMVSSATGDWSTQGPAAVVVDLNKPNRASVTGPSSWAK